MRSTKPYFVRAYLKLNWIFIIETRIRIAWSKNALEAKTGFTIILKGLFTFFKSGNEFKVKILTFEGYFDINN